MKRALVFCGGGSKGAYQMGVWQVLRELNIADFDIVCGTSIGSLNAVMYAQNDFERCNEIWNTTRNNTIMTVPITVDKTGIKGTIKNIKDLVPFLRSYIKEKGADITPFKELMETYIDPLKVKGSKVEFGLVTVKFPSMEPCFVKVSELEPNLIIPFVLASCSCFPLFPLCKIEGVNYIDGGYFDNLPIDLALEMGAEEIVAIDLDINITHPEYLNKPFIKYIYPSQSLGGFFDFKPELVKENRILGYNDGLKFFGKLLGYKYSFNLTKVNHREALKYYRNLLRLMKEFKIRKIKSQVKTPEGSDLFKILEKDIYKPLTVEDYYIRGIEEAASLFEIDYYRVYDLEEMKSLIMAKVNELKSDFNQMDEYFTLTQKTKRRSYLLTQDKFVVLNELLKLREFNNNLLFDILEVYPKILLTFIIFKLWSD